MTTNENFTNNLIIPPQLEAALGFNITRAADLFRKELIRALAEYNITPEQWQVFASLWWADRPLTQRDICFLTLKEKPTISRMIDVMVKRGWIKKAQSSTDARATEIVLTKKGMQLKDEVPKKLIAHFMPFLNQLTEQEHTQLLSLTKKIRTIFNERNDQ